MFAATLILMALAALVSLITGAWYLGVLLPGGLPVGNVLAAIAVSAPAGAALLLSQPGTGLRRISVASLLVALAWLPVSIALAGNLALNFNGPSGQLWMAFTVAISVVVTAALCWALGSQFIDAWRR